MKKTIQQVRDEFNHSSISIAEWSRENNFPPSLVYQILNHTRIPSRGKSHLIAVKLGIKQ
ncbi:DNA-binding protein [Acinetobacter sp. SK-43]|uniref:DNA-binding protein n=1 Tax=Acinetobacter sp. SK-43 TaxID=2785295 RepID=UPI00188C65CE|nr:DNA-binding protein [Acinetobacter sp. SK-43]MBF4455825.1 DNA-binding protein [Acinetobacter sp. SK-43]